MTKLLVGCAGFRGPVDSYARRFDLVELSLFDRENPPNAATLRKWRKQAGPTLTIAIVAPRAVCAVRPGEAFDAALESLLEAQRLTEAQRIVLPTPIEVTPSPLQRERLQATVEKIRAGLGAVSAVVAIAWEPRGVWENESAAAFARQIGVDLVVDPLADLREPFWDVGLRYLRLRASGGREVYPPTRLRMLVELLRAARQDDAEAGRPDTHAIVFATPRAPVEVKRLRTLMQKGGAEARVGRRVGAGRVLEATDGALDEADEELEDDALEDEELGDDEVEGEAGSDEAGSDEEGSDDDFDDEESDEDDEDDDDEDEEDEEDEGK